MKVTLGDLAIDVNDVLRFEKNDAYDIATIEVYVRTNTKTGETSMRTSFDSKEQRDASYEKLLELWAGEDLKRL